MPGFATFLSSVRFLGWVTLRSSSELEGQKEPSCANVVDGVADSEGDPVLCDAVEVIIGHSPTRRARVVSSSDAPGGLA